MVDPAFRTRSSTIMFGLFDNGEMPVETGSRRNGLVRTLDVGCTIHTGIDGGDVEVAVALPEKSPSIDTVDAIWEEVVEVTVSAPRGELYVGDVREGRTPGSPLLSKHGGRPYRIRVHARGRDEAYDQYVADSAESYLFVVWPATEPTEESVIRSQDRCGNNLRASVAASATRPEPSELYPRGSYEAPDEERRERRARLRERFRRLAEEDVSE